MSNISYEDLLNSPAFREDLSQLNHVIAQSLIDAGEPVAINGTVCYGHMQKDFHLGDMAPGMEPKRRVLQQLAQEVDCFAEVGVAGGHAALVALHSNPSLKFIGIDLGQRLRQSWPPVDVYVPVVFEWLRSKFPDRVRVYTAQAVQGLKLAVSENPFGPIGLLHLDAQKNNRIAELEAAWPGLADCCYLMQGDNKNGKVKESSAHLIADGRARPVRSAKYKDLIVDNFDVLETGPGVSTGRLNLDSLHNDRILVCVCHQDDETLFCGSTLSQLKGRADVTVASFFRPAPNRRDTDTREAAMQRVCEALGAKYVQFPFAVERDHRRLRRFIRMPSNLAESSPELTRPIHRHALFGLLAGSAFALMEQIKPSTIITHNSVGEYGHIEHVLLHHAVLDAARRHGAGHVLAFGVNMPNADLVVPTRPEEKNRLFDEYMPQWNGRKPYDFALADETYVKVDLTADEA